MAKTAFDEKFIRMTQAPVRGLIIRMAVPTIVSMLISAAYNMADTFFVCQLNNTSATGAIGIAFPLMSVIQGIGFTFIEVLSTCPTNWGLSPVAAMNLMEQNMIPYYPLGVYKDKEAK